MWAKAAAACRGAAFAGLGATAACAGRSASTDPQVLESEADWAGFLCSLSGKRVLHVKGFGSGFKSPTEEQQIVQNRQIAEARKALSCFCPDYVVVDGDPWGSGFQCHVKQFANNRREQGKLKVIWVKTAQLDDDGKPTPACRNRYMKQALEWASQDFEVTVGWLDATEVNNMVDELFGPSARSKLQPVGFLDRGALLLLSSEEPQAPRCSVAPASWLSRLVESAEGSALLDAIRAIETRSERTYFERCSFENAAKGNAIFRLLNRAENLEAHGAISFGGGESVLLEFGSLYLNPGSADLIGRGHVALLPFSRGRGGRDPALPKHVGESFGGPQLPGAGSE